MSPLLILTPNKKQSHYLVGALGKEGYTVGIFKDQGHFFSTEMLSHWLEMRSWKRKETIFMLKVATAILESQTGIIDELKYYGDERDMIDLFRSEVDEENLFFEKYNTSLLSSQVLIADLYSPSLGQVALIP
jgi:hypothetical protein